MDRRTPLSDRVKGLPSDSLAAAEVPTLTSAGGALCLSPDCEGDVASVDIHRQLQLVLDRQVLFQSARRWSIGGWIASA